MGTPSSAIVPAVGLVSRASIRATVDLPLPDSPTRAMVFPDSRVNDTSSTATSFPRPREEKTLRSPVTSSVLMARPLRCW